MKRFVWRLQKVLDVKTNEEQTKRLELLRITERLAETRGVLLAQQRILKEMLLGITVESSCGRLKSQEFFLRHCSASDEQIKRLRTMVTVLKFQQQQTQGEVLEVRRFKEGLEKLRSQAKQRFVFEQERIEQKELDEMASIRFLRDRTVVQSRR